jgi:hypothetical protein
MDPGSHSLLDSAAALQGSLGRDDKEGRGPHSRGANAPKIHDAAPTKYLGRAASALSRWSLKSSSTGLLRDCHDGTLAMARSKIGFLSQQPSPVSALVVFPSLRLGRDRHDQHKSTSEEAGEEAKDQTEHE